MSPNERSARERGARAAELSGEERVRILDTWNATARDYPRDASIHGLFEELAIQTPQVIALTFEGIELTYDALNRRANTLAHRLLALGVGRGSLVGLCVERSVEMVVALLAILKAGGAYLPLDPAYPAERLGFMVSDSGATVMLAQTRHAARVPHATLVLLDGEPSACEDDTNPGVPVAATDLAYVMYTSGSTGRPKGVCIPHRGVVRLVRNTDYAELTSADVFLQLSPISFDAATFEIWASLLNGAKLAVFPPHAPSTDELGRAIAALGITTLFLTAGLFHLMVDAELESFASVRQLLSGGDVLSPAHVRKVRERFPRCHLVNAYGPTENTVMTTCFAVTTAEHPSVPIGRPIANTRVYILDADRRPVPVGAVGELYTGGDGLARGYHRRPALTEERFVPSPFDASERLYRTGDLARYLPSGDIEFLGRLDHQVKVRGFRIELGEIEVALADHGAVSKAIVLAREDAAGEKRLVAYVVSDQPVPARTLRAHLAAKLPGHMIPSAFVALLELPLTPNGKVDRRALPAPTWGAESRAYVAPRTATEEALAHIWAEILGVERVGVDDDFFDLGGHSLSATQIASRVRRGLGVELPVAAFFSAPTVAALAKRVEGSTRGGPGDFFGPTARPGASPLSSAQERLWFLHQLAPESAAYNVSLARRLSGPLDVEALHASLDALVERHEVLRTTYASQGGAPVQCIAAHGACPLAVVDGAPLDDAASARVLRVATEAPFDLERGPVLRATLLRQGKEDHVLLLCVHHIAFDGWSVGVLLAELSALYAAFVGPAFVGPSGAAPALRSLPLQYADFAIWQRRRLERGELDSQLEHWKRTLEGARNLDLPTDWPRPAVPKMRGESLPVRLAAPIVSALRRVAQDGGATLFMTLLAAYQVLLHRHARQSDVCVGIPIANRTRDELEGLIGFFVDTLVIRTRIEDDATFAETLAQVRGACLEAYANQDVPFERVVSALGAGRDRSRSPLFEAMFVLQNTPPSPLVLGGVIATPLEVTTAAAQFDVTLDLEEHGDEIRGALEYDADLFASGTMARMLEHFLALLESIAQAPEERLARLSLSSERERSALRAWNATSRAAPACAGIHDLFEEQVARAPEAVAVESPERSLTYAELNARANQLAHRLASLGVGRESLVGICVRRSPKRSLTALVARHEALRTTFPRVSGQPVQAVAEPRPFSLSVVPVHALPAGMRAKETAKRTLDSEKRPFDLARGPLFRGSLLTLGAEEHVLLLATHHIVFDGWSWNVLLRDLFSIYRSELTGTGDVLAPLSVQFGDFVLWQDAHLQGETFDVLLAYWKAHLQGDRPSTELPTDFPRPKLRSYAGALRKRNVPSALLEATRILGRREGASTYMVLLAAFYLLLAEQTDHSDLVVGGATANRQSPEIQGVIGFFVNMVALRVNLRRHATFRALISEVKAVVLGAEEHQDLPFEYVVRAVSAPHDPSRMPLFQTVLRHEELPEPIEVSGTNLEVTDLASYEGSAKLDLELVAAESPAGLALTAQYDVALFEPRRIDDLLERYHATLERFVKDPDSPLFENEQTP